MPNLENDLRGYIQPLFDKESDWFLVECPPLLTYLEARLVCRHKEVFAKRLTFGKNRMVWVPHAKQN